MYYSFFFMYTVQYNGTATIGAYFPKYNYQFKPIIKRAKNQLENI